MSSPGLAIREPVFTTNDCARLFQVVVEEDNRLAAERENVPLARAELDRTHAGLWAGTLVPMYNRASYAPVPPKRVGKILEDDVRGIDPRRFSGPRDATKLESHYRSLRSAYTVANEMHKGTGKTAWGEIKLYVIGDSRLLFIHCVLFCTPVMGFVLRTIPPVAQCELGLPGSAAVVQPVQRRALRPKVAEVTIQGMGGSTEARAGVAQAVLGPTAASVATDIQDNAQAVGTVMEPVPAARRDLAGDPDDPTAQLVVKHLLAQPTKLTAPDS